VSALAVSPLGETVGAEVRGLSGADLLADDTLPAAVLAALDRHGVLVFRGIGVDDATHAAFSQRLDQVGKATPAPLPDVDTVSLDPAVSRSAEYTRGTFGWHIDGAQDEVPTKATVLSAKTLAARGGETEFASTYAVHDDLSAEERRGLAPLRVVHSFRASQRLAFPDPTPEQEARWAQKPGRRGPGVCTATAGAPW
jgi:alpha-ketoglutarate-dependent taurine dioxygenase